ncbi:MAG: TIGR00730 family Rossman fold protein [Deferribacteres bacterium]|nr:TIGR00730 family Rossman fold protein [candidate division KSB1 bacterium]MCB9502278.1 TIGR00730 family Rossman fold protein [Deferribacteres bacterium]
MKSINQHNRERIKNSPSYRLAYQDEEFLGSNELRPLRLQLELLKPEMVMDAHNITSTVVIFGSARICSKEEIEKALKNARNKKDEIEMRQLETKLKYAHYYEEARKLTRLLGEKPIATNGDRLIVVTGGGPGIMEAANRGAYDANSQSIGLNITLDHEQEPNPYISPELCFQFQYFAIRKMHFLLRAKALVAFPGGFGTFDELFEALTLIQTGRMPKMPVYLFSKEFWSGAVNFDFLVDSGVISREDLDLFVYMENAEDLWQHIKDYYRK